MSTTDPQQYQPLEYTAELVAAPTAWKSIPTPIRFVVWLWAVCVILGLIGAVIGALIWVLAFGAALSQL